VGTRLVPVQVPTAEPSTGPVAHGRATAAEARSELRVIRKLLDQAVGEYRSRKGALAAELVGDIYADHLARIETPLAARDRALARTLDRSIGTTLRSAMRTGQPKHTVRALARSIRRDLTRAEKALR
jgi:hypothetical protein